MEGLTTLLEALRARHAEFLDRNWDSLSAEDAKRFTQIERDITAVNAALGKPAESFTPELRGSLERLQAALG